MAIQKTSLSRETLGEAAYRYLFQGFLNKELVPGTRLLMDELAEQMGISRTPVREALQRLEREGVIEPHGGRGYVVCETTTDELDHRYEAREAIEGYAVRRAATFEAEARAQLVAEYETLLTRPQTTAEEVFLANRDVHRMIVRALDNTYLVESFDLLWNRVLTSDIWARMLDNDDVVGSFDREHRPLFDAIASGDADHAHKIMLTHIHSGRSLHQI
ncbi:GntR family transcriptional regulator [Leucobacter rhizosphaerae]|uniref:GntR family transcriptional regulator n=1 Tax=Leucobacter rhizosphaerae TaxID=2932245 RepID=A0ABY4FTQ0_9MICO|nr:GntR family transcriptional regulator [Leucobacter rhizosphaerae]UOQ59668.1 GntR family transcriptional regulator [Leucobacter rhizosphaerae]